MKQNRENSFFLFLDDVANLLGFLLAWPIRFKIIWSLPIYWRDQSNDI